MLARVLVGDDHHELGDLVANHPSIQLRHNLLDVGLHLVIGRHQHVEAILLDRGEVLRRVHSTLKSGNTIQ